MHREIFHLSCFWFCFGFMLPHINLFVHVPSDVCACMWMSGCMPRLVCAKAGTTCRSLFCLSTMWVPGDQTQVIWVGYKCVYPLPWQPWFWVLFLETGLHSVCQVGLESAVWPPLAAASASSVLRWQAWATTFVLVFLSLEKADDTPSHACWPLPPTFSVCLGRSASPSILCCVFICSRIEDHAWVTSSP